MTQENKINRPGRKETAYALYCVVGARKIIASVLNGNPIDPEDIFEFGSDLRLLEGHVVGGSAILERAEELLETISPNDFKEDWNSD